MKTLLCSVLALVAATLSLGQTPAPMAEVGAPKRTPEELEKLVAPIALYPDSLVALILPASTASSDLVLAARYLAANGDPNAVDAQPWDDSVKGLARYPDLVKWMDENLEWTRELGETFAVQPSDVMTSIQKLREDARSRGLLVDTPQQKVVVEDRVIAIEPAQPDVIYIPTYDPDVLLIRRPIYEPWLGFSVGFAAGNWLFYDCDWGRRSVYVYHRPPGWAYRHGWRWDAHRHGHHGAFEHWRPNPRYWHRHNHFGPRPMRPIVRPAHPPRFDHRDHRNDDRRGPRLGRPDWRDGRRDLGRGDPGRPGFREGDRRDGRPERRVDGGQHRSGLHQGRIIQPPPSAGPNSVPQARIHPEPRWQRPGENRGTAGPPPAGRVPREQGRRSFAPAPGGETPPVPHVGSAAPRERHQGHRPAYSPTERRSQPRPEVSSSERHQGHRPAVAPRSEPPAPRQEAPRARDDSGSSDRGTNRVDRVHRVMR